MWRRMWERFKWYGVNLGIEIRVGYAWLREGTKWDPNCGGGDVVLGGEGIRGGMEQKVESSVGG